MTRVCGNEMNKDSCNTFLVIGPTGHLGPAMCLELAKVATTLILVGRSQRKLDLLKVEIQEKFQKLTVKIFVCDLTNELEVRKTCQLIHDFTPKLAGLVFNAFSGSVGPLPSTGTQEIDLATKVNISSPILIINDLIDLLKQPLETKNSSIVLVSSMYGAVSPDFTIYDDPGKVPSIQYCVTKGGVIQMARYLASYLGQYNIRVNSVSPGAFPQPKNLQNRLDFADKLRSKVPLRRLGRPEELATCVKFLLTSESSYVTGTNLCVDGGWTAL